MRKFRSWRDLSVSTKLYALVGVMGLLIATELLTLRFAMGTLSSVRAFVGGEGLWSKGQKTAIIALRRYKDTHAESDYQDFVKAIGVNLGDHDARIEMAKPNLDFEATAQGFVRGHNHPDDVPGLIRLVRRFYWEPHLAKALGIWAHADEMMTVLLKQADDLHMMIINRKSAATIESQMRKIENFNEEFTTVEDAFSNTLGEGSRWLENLVMNILLALVLTVESTGLFLTISFSRTLSKSLIELRDGAVRVGRGIFTEKIPVRSGDELGQLATELNSMTEKINETIGSRNQAERASETKSAFLANMSHEIRTPLGAILGFTDVLKDESLSHKERTEYLGIVERNGKALMRVIDDILDLSKVEAGRLAIEELEFSLPALLNDVVDLFAPLASNKGIKLSLEIDPNAKKAIGSDPTRLRQIITNIIGNALKFTAVGGITVQVRAQRIDPATELIRFEISDTGLGLRPDEQEKLFNAFTQADDSTSRKFGGTGLGLVLSRKLAQALGGNVFISRSEIGRGSTFVIEILNRAANDHLAIAQIPHFIEDAKVEGASVLVVEDSTDIRALLRVLLKRHGVNADFAVNGAEGLDCALRKDYDVVLLDIQMPGIDGYQVLSRLRARNYKRPVIALTAHAMKEDRERSHAAGFNEHLTKPIDENALIETIHAYRGVSV